MILKIKADTKHRGRTYREGEVVDVPDMWADEMIEYGQAETTERRKLTNLIRPDYPKGSRLLVKLPEEG